MQPIDLNSTNTEYLERLRGARHNRIPWHIEPVDAIGTGHHLNRAIIFGAVIDLGV